MDTDTDSDTTNRLQLIGTVEKSKVFDHDQDPTDPDQALLEKQNDLLRDNEGHQVLHWLDTHPGH